MVALPAPTDQPADTADEDARGLRGWLLFLVFLVFAMVMVGGATRLTESGLSITEWDLVTGAVPPLDGKSWQSEFDLYRQSPQYELTEPGHEPWRIQDHLLVGVGAPRARPLHRARLRRGLLLVRRPAERAAQNRA